MSSEPTAAQDYRLSARLRAWLSGRRVSSRRLAVVALVLCVLVTVVSFVLPRLDPAPDPGGDGQVTPEAARAIAELAEHSVYLEAGGDWTMDVARARELIGDRPLLVAAFSDLDRFDDQAERYQREIERYDGDKQGSLEAGYTEALLDFDVPLLMTCRDIAASNPDSLVVVIHPRPNFRRTCLGPEFGDPDELDEHFGRGIAAVAGNAAEARVAGGDQTEFVAELVGAYERSIKRLDSPPGGRDLGERYRQLTIAGYVSAGVAAALLLYLLAGSPAHAIEAASRRRRELGVARAKALSDLHRLAEVVVRLEREHLAHWHQRDATEHAELMMVAAERYLAVVREYEQAGTAEQFAEVSAIATDAVATTRQLASETAL